MLKNPIEHPKNAAAIAISIAATTFVGHPLIYYDDAKGWYVARR